MGLIWLLMAGGIEEEERMKEGEIEEQAHVSTARGH